MFIILLTLMCIMPFVFSFTLVKIIEDIVKNRSYKHKNVCFILGISLFMTMVFPWFFFTIGIG